MYEVVYGRQCWKAGSVQGGVVDFLGGINFFDQFL